MALGWIASLFANKATGKVAETVINAGAKIIDNRQQIKLAKQEAQMQDIRTGGIVASTRAKYWWAVLFDLFLVMLIFGPIITGAVGVYNDMPMLVDATMEFTKILSALPEFYDNIIYLVIGGIYGIRATSYMKGK